MRQFQVLGFILLLQGCVTVQQQKPVKIPAVDNEFTIMTFNTKWLMGDESQVERLKKKGIWGLGDKDEESEIALQHQSVATLIVRHLPDILCLQEVINEVAAKRLQKTLGVKGIGYDLHFLNSRDTFLEQDVAFMTRKGNGKISNIELSHPKDPYNPSKCLILKCEVDGERTAFIGLHLKSVPTKTSSVEKREKQADSVIRELNALKPLGYSPVVIGDINDWDPIIPDSDGAPKATPTSTVLKRLKDYEQGGDNELINSLKWVEPLEQRYTYDYKGSRTVLDHILLPKTWKKKIIHATIDHDRPEGASDHWPLIVKLRRN
ncbi:MAG: endonuclease/exonuclease/phosphatase family protein [Opitutae bacterium]|jgi:endonuclease/exonuclease/phosphatase family metal-dependent hydrolase|nr:endonuclease/exonuclease/phosphatase family protein [Opitutae bacterium]